MGRLEDIVSENRFTISVIFPLVGAAVFLASAEGVLPDFLSFNPLLILFGTLVMRTPLIAGLKPLADRKLMLGVVLITAYTYLIEFVGLKTGFPYGEFEYLVQLGPMLQGVPLGLPIFFVPLVLNSYLLSHVMGIGNFWKRIPASLVILIGIDLVLDPAAVALGIWQYQSGIYYGVPIQNFLGWLLSGAITLIIVEFSFDSEAVSKRIQEVDFILDDMVSFVLLWGLVNLYYLNLVPSLVLAAIGLFLYRIDRFDFAWSLRQNL
jgi:putative membrane protein